MSDSSSATSAAEKARLAMKAAASQKAGPARKAAPADNSAAAQNAMQTGHAGTTFMGHYGDQSTFEMCVGCGKRAQAPPPTPHSPDSPRVT